jgi:hypothetical protein
MFASNGEITAPTTPTSALCTCDSEAAMSTDISSFPKTRYQHFLRAESKGRHFLSNIRNCFPYERMAKLRVA